MDTVNEAATAGEEQPFEWAIVEIFGHRKHAGRTREEERFGSKMLRIDVPSLLVDPVEEGKVMSWSVEKWTTFYYGGASIFSFTLTDEATVMRASRPYIPASRYLPPPVDDDDDFERPF